MNEADPTPTPRTAFRSGTLDQLAGLARDGRLPRSLMLSGPQGPELTDAAISLAAVAACGEPLESDETVRLVERIKATERWILAGSDPERSPWPGPGRGPYPDVRVLRPDSKGRSGQIKVDDMRKALDANRSRPFEGRRRTLVISPADAMHPAASNTLLKTLEEPNDWLGLILCARREASLLPTVASRCQKWRLPAPTVPETAALLRSEHGYSEEDAATASAATSGDLEAALDLPADRLAALRIAAEKIAAKVGEGIPAPARAALTKEITGPRAVSKGREQTPLPPLRPLLALVRAVLRDLALIASGGGVPLATGPGARERLAPTARLAPPDAWAEGLHQAERTDDRIHRSFGNARMQFDAMLLQFNDIARPLAQARKRAKVHS